MTLLGPVNCILVKLFKNCDRTCISGGYQQLTNNGFLWHFTRHWVFSVLHYFVYFQYPDYHLESVYM